MGNKRDNTKNMGNGRMGLDSILCDCQENTLIGETVKGIELK